jgi:hypothetical protein
LGYSNFPRIEIGEIFQYRGVGLEIVDMVMHLNSVERAHIVPGPQANQMTLFRDQMNIVFRKKEFKYKFSY